jgi:MFS family permease
MQESLFFFTEALFVYQWSKASDKIGRKPVLMIGMVGTMLSMLFFGLSRTFTTLVIRSVFSVIFASAGICNSITMVITSVAVSVAC